MNYQFPHDLTLAETREVVNRHNERLGVTSFIEANRGEFTIFNYVVAFPGSFPEVNTGDPALDREYAILRECRGITFHTEGGHVLSRKFHKFFNIGEKAETQPNVIDWSRPHVILEKLDGSMITPLITGDMNDISFEKLRWCTKMGMTDVAAPVEAWVAKNEAYAGWAVGVMLSGYTPIFEWCSRQQKIVIDYPDEGLVLTAVRNNRTGNYLPYDEILKAKTHGIRVVGVLPGSITSIDAFLEHTRGLKGVEGYVVVFPDGMLKAKAEEYCLMHKTKEALTFEKDVWAIVLSESVDDLKAMMDAGDLDRVERFETALLTAIDVRAQEIETIVANARAEVGDDKKRFVMEIGPSIPNNIRGLAFNVWSGNDAREAIRRVLLKNCGSSTKVNEIRSLVGGISWDTYRGAAIDLDA